MGSRLFALIVMLACLPAVALTIAVRDPVKLSRADRAKIEQEACKKPYRVRAEKISGWHDTLAPRSQRSATVVCAPHEVTADYRAHYDVGCSKEASGWECEAFLNLRIGFMTQDAKDVDLDNLPVDQGIRMLRCLETGLRQSPQLLSGTTAELGLLSLQSRGPQRTPEILASLMTANNRCLTVSFDSACDTNEQVPLDLVSDDCLDE